jgi:hypothetical protein
MLLKDSNRQPGWLIFFYSVPSKPVSNRMKIWRRLAKAGALPFSGAVYILPDNEEHSEFLLWLITDITSMGGEGAFIRAEKIETVKNTDLIRLFYQQKKDAYLAIEKRLDDLDRKINSIRKGSDAQDVRGLTDNFARLSREFGEIRRTDFFSSPAGEGLHKRLKNTGKEIKGVSGPDTGRREETVKPRKIRDYQDRTWVSRKKPFVDRMASAWLIKTFIDKQAVFKLMEDSEIEALGSKVVTFDIKAGEFTHAGDMCTFEVLVKAFGLKNRALRRIAELVHQLDINDEKYQHPEAEGVKDILTGIRKTARNDLEALEKGMAVFGMLYASNI